MRVVSKIVVLATLFVTAVACIDAPVYRPGVSPDDEARELHLFVDVPAAGQSAAARAVTATEENTIRTVDVLAFRVDGANETFDYAATATATSTSTPGATTQAFVTSLRMRSYPQRFVLVTNARQQVQSVVGSAAQGTPKATLLSQLRFDLATGQDRWTAVGSQNYTPIPMWGESAPETVSSATRNLTSTILLMRMVARLDVRLDAGVVGLADRFKIRSVALYNTNSGGRIVPDASKVITEQRNGQTYLRVNATSVPADLAPYSARRPGPIVYTDFTAPGVADVSMAGAIYTFETTNSATDSEATCIVVGGLFGTDTEPSYYRVELLDPATQTRLDVLRNNQYVVNITNVLARGFATAAEAFNSRAVNMTARVLEWNDPRLSSVTFDGQNYMASDKGQVTLYNNAYTAPLVTGENVLQLSTDVPTGWSVERITAPDGVTPAPWLTMYPTSGPAGAITAAFLNLTANNTGVDRSAMIRLAAGRLRMSIRVNQTVRLPVSVSILNSSNQEITELVFPNPVADQQPAAQTLRVNWQPAASSVIVSASQVGGTSAPFPDPGNGSNDGAPFNSMPWPWNTGTHDFSIQPPALTTAELNANPLINKRSRYFMISSNGPETAIKQVILTQLRYNLLTEPNPFPQPYFPMDGNRYNYNVRANTTWRISNIVETPRTAGARLIAPPTGEDNVYVGATGGADITVGGGVRQALTTNPAARGMSGYADVTYSSDQTPAQFAPVTRRLFFPAANFNIYGITGMNNSNANVYNIFAGSTDGRNMQSMLTNPAAYGTNVTGPAGTPSSTVFVRSVIMNGYNNSSVNAINATHITAATAAGADMLVISGSTSFDQGAAVEIYSQFLARDKPVMLFTEDPNPLAALFVVLRDAGRLSSFSDNMYWSTSGLNGNAPVYWYYTYADGQEPIINGRFGNLNGRYWGCDGYGSVAYWFTNSAGAYSDANIIPYSNARNQSGNTDNPPNGLPAGGTMDNGYTMFRFRNVPLIVVADGGFMGTFDAGSITSSPAVITTGTMLPAGKIGYGGGATKQTVYNSPFIANAVAWAIQRRTTN